MVANFYEQRKWVLFFTPNKGSGISLQKEHNEIKAEEESNVNVFIEHMDIGQL